ncbi:DMT family transporter [Leifsonia poae]|uniref:DMT family transporter n=1 Tax=Leifsonia poae TaxID=110933 RepID=UPI001CBD98C2|nr:DMT family transporter [Leifsonia poae]
MIRYITWSRLLPFLFLPVYGSGYIAGALGLQTMRPFAMTFWRFTIAEIVVMTIALVRRTRWPRGWRQWWPILAVGLLIQVVQFGGNYTAMGLGMPAGLTSLIAGSSSLMMAIGAVPFLRERLTGWRLVGVFVGFIGIAVALAGHLGVPSGPAGVFAAFCAAVGYAGGSLLQRKCLVGVDIWLSVAIQFAVAAPVAFVLAEVTGGVAVPLSAGTLVPLGWIALVNSVGGMWLLGQMLRHHTAATLSAWSNLIPPFTALLAIPFLGQPMSVSLGIGLAIALTGTALVVLPSRRGAEGANAAGTNAAGANAAGTNAAGTNAADAEPTHSDDRVPAA